MNLRTAFSLVPGLGWVGRQPQRAATRPIQWTYPGSEIFGPGVGNQPDIQTLLKESTGPFDSASRALSNRISELEPQVLVRRRMRSGTVEDEILDDHPCKLLLDKPHPNLTRAQWLFLMARQIIATGECYLLKVGNGLNVPVELHNIPPHQIKPLVRDGRLVGYGYTDGLGRQSTFPANVIIRCFFPDPENPWGAEGYLSPSGIEADAHKFAGQHLRHHYQNDATPKGVLELEPEAQMPNADARRRFDSEWGTAYYSRDARDRGPAMLPPGYEYKQLTVDTREGVAPLLEYWRDNLLMALATPRSVLGQVVSGDRSSAETNQYIFDRYAVKPVANLIANGLTLQLAPDFDKSLIIAFEDFVSKDEELEIKKEAHDLEHALKTPNKILTDRGDDEVEWGDQPLIAGTLGPYDPELALEAMAAPPMAPGGEPGEEEPAGDDDDRLRRRMHALIDYEFKHKRRRQAA